MAHIKLKCVDGTYVDVDSRKLKKTDFRQTSNTDYVHVTLPEDEGFVLVLETMDELHKIVDQAQLS